MQSDIFLGLVHFLLGLNSDQESGKYGATYNSVYFNFLNREHII